MLIVNEFRQSLSIPVSRLYDLRVKFWQPTHQSREASKWVFLGVFVLHGGFKVTSAWALQYVKKAWDPIVLSKDFPFRYLESSVAELLKGLSPQQLHRTLRVLWNGGLPYGDFASSYCIPESLTLMLIRDGLHRNKTTRRSPCPLKEIQDQDREISLACGGALQWEPRKVVIRGGRE